MRILGLVPARGGSKGVPRKNIRQLGRKPLVAYTIDAAKRAQRLDRVVISTEDEEIANIAKALGAEVPFMRPPELARDDSPTLSVVQHALRTLEDQGWRCDAICLLQPTFPFRVAADIDACIEKFEETQADCVVTVHPVPHQYNPHWVYFEGPDGLLRISTGEVAPIPRRQLLPAAFHRSGSIYVTRTEVVLEQSLLYGRRLVGYETPTDDCCNIDTLEDWARAEALLSSRTEPR